MPKLSWDKLWAQKLPLFLIIFFFTFTPVLAYLVSVRFQAQDFLNLQKLLEQNSSNLTQAPNISSLEQLKKNLEARFSKTQTNSPGTFSGPTLHFQLAIEGRLADQSTRAFVGIAKGQPTNSPTYLLSFLVDVPYSGEYSGLAVTGLDIGTTYTAYIKGASQLTKAVSFTSQPAVNDLGLIALNTGDLNEDNVISSADLDIERSLVGKTPNSVDWNKYADFNQDGVINNIDLTYINKNIGKTGDSGPWVSSPLKNATTPSTLGISTEATSEASPAGYWLWIPKF